MTRRLVRPALREDGFSVMEVLVVTVVLSIVLAIAFSFLASSSTITARADANTQVEKDGQAALREITQELRALSPGSATSCSQSGWPTSQANCLSFTVKRIANPNVECPKTTVSIGLVGTGRVRKLMIARNEYHSTTGTCPGTATIATPTKTLLDNVVNPTTGTVVNLFTYYGTDGSILNPATAGFSVGAVDTLKLNLRLEYRSGVDPVSLRSTVALRNNNSR